MRQGMRTAIAAAVVLGLGSAAHADQVDDYVKAELAKRQVPGASIAVVKDGKIVKAEGYGLANVELSVSATPDTVYQLASVTKQFTAAAIMMLAEDGKLGLADKIHKHLPSLPAAWSDVTVRHLLDHTSGIKSYTSLPDFFKSARKDYTHGELIKLVADAPMDFKPGEKWAYNNTGYFLLGMIIEKTSGKSYGDFLDERIFKPLGMTSTRVNDLRSVIRNRAQGYSLDGGKLINGEYVSPSQPYSAGALVSTVIDMAKWDAALYSEGLLRKSAREMMWTPAKLNDGKGTGYGLGWGIGDRNGHKLVDHGGGIPGFSTFIARYLDDKLTVIVLANSDNAPSGGIANGIAALYEPALKVTQAKAITDKNPAVTAMLRKAMETLLAGKKEGIALTPEFDAFLTPERIQLGPSLKASFGGLKGFELLKTSEQGKATVYEYRASFGTTPHHVMFVVTEDGKIAGANIRPE